MSQVPFWYHIKRLAIISRKVSTSRDLGDKIYRLALKIGTTPTTLLPRRLSNNRAITQPNAQILEPRQFPSSIQPYTRQLMWEWTTLDIFVQLIMWLLHSGAKILSHSETMQNYEIDPVAFALILKGLIRCFLYRVARSCWLFINLSIIVYHCNRLQLIEYVKWFAL